MSSIFYDNNLRRQLLKAKGSSGLIFQKDLYLINLIKRKHKKQVPVLSIKDSHQMMNLPRIINLTNRNQITIDNNSSDSDHLSNRLTNKRQSLSQKNQYTSETVQSKKKRISFKVKQHTMSMNNIHRQFTKIITPVSFVQHCAFLKNKEIVALIEKSKKLC